MKKIIFLILIAFSVSAMAEPKRLVCKSPSEDEVIRLRSAAEEFRDPKFVAYNTQSAKDFEEHSNQCVGADYGFQNTFVFDTDGLKNPASSNVEVGQTFLCGHKVGDVVKGSLEATPSIITFKFGNRSFNIDRKTLAGGYDTKRNFTCELLNVDMSKNLL